MSMAYEPLAAVVSQLVSVAAEQGGNLRLDGLRQQRSRAVAQNLGQRIGKSSWLGELENISLGHGVSLLWWRSGGVEYPHDTPPYPFLPSPTSAHSSVDLLIIQIDGLHIGNDLVLVTALGIDGNGDRHPLGLVERATENTAVVQALIDNLIERGLDRRSVGCSSSTAPRR